MFCRFVELLSNYLEIPDSVDNNMIIVRQEDGSKRFVSSINQISFTHVYASTKVIGSKKFILVFKK